MRISFDYYENITPMQIPEENILGVYEPKRDILSEPEDKIIKRGFINPVGTPRIRKMVNRSKKVLIIADDNTRTTPAKKILPYIIEELKNGGIQEKNIRILIALGTHRSMNKQEIIDKFGRGIYENNEILNHEWKDKNQLEYIGETSSGIRVSVNKLILEVDFSIGLGSVVPHDVAGFSGGAKIIQPGICGPETTGSTHWISASFEQKDILGVVKNPVRLEMEKMARMVGLNAIVNVVQDGSGQIVDLVVGDVVKAHRKAVETSRKIYGVKIPDVADIVVVDSHPADLELWQATKGICAADLVVKKGGIIVLVTLCPEGIASQHPAIVDYGYLLPKDANKMMKEGKLTDINLAAHLIEIGRITLGKARCIIVSQGINQEIAEKIGFLYAETPQNAIEKAFASKGKDAKVIVMKRGGHILPIVESS